VLQVRNKAGDILVIDGLYDRTLPKVPFIFTCLGGQDMTGKSMAPFDLAGAGLLETLRGAPVGLDFGHGISPLLK